MTDGKKDSSGADEEFDIGNPDVLVDCQLGNLDCWEGNVREGLKLHAAKPWPADDEVVSYMAQSIHAEEHDELIGDLRKIAQFRALWARVEKAEAEIERQYADHVVRREAIIDDVNRNADICERLARERDAMRGVVEAARAMLDDCFPGVPPIPPESVMALHRALHALDEATFGRYWLRRRDYARRKQRQIIEPKVGRAWRRFRRNFAGGPA